MAMGELAAPITASRRRGGRRRSNWGHLRRAAPLLVALGATALWETLVRLLHTPVYFLPPPSAVLQVMVTEWSVLWSNSLYSIQIMLFGFLLGVAVGVPIAVMIAISPIFEESVNPLLVSSQVIPKVAIAPLFVVWFGFGLLPKVLIAFLNAVFPVIVNTTIGLKAIEVEKLYLARSMGASPLETFLWFRLPFALPYLFGGLKLSITFSVVGAIVGEFIGSERGLGRLLLISISSFEAPMIFAAIAYLAIIGTAFYLMIDVLERLCIPWHVSHRVQTVSSSN